MKKILSSLLTLSMATTVNAFAQEPTNLENCKQAVISYHDSGQYQKELDSVVNHAIAYLKTRITQPFPAGKQPAIVLDIDETALSNYPDMVRLNFGGTMKEISEAEDKGHDAAIAPTLKLYRFAKAHQIAVFFITGRHEPERDTTTKNLHAVGYHHWDGLTLRDGIYNDTPAAVYKPAVRKKLSENGYDIILSMGDQESDLTGGYAEKTVKLPNPYYFIP